MLISINSRMISEFNFPKVADEILVEVGLPCLQCFQVPHVILSVTFIFRDVASDDARASVFQPFPNE
jgi:hypothetical protein